MSVVRLDQDDMPRPEPRGHVPIRSTMLERGPFPRWLGPKYGPTATWTEMHVAGSTRFPGSAHLETMTMPRRVCFLFGQERPGAFMRA